MHASSNTSDRLARRRLLGGSGGLAALAALEATITASAGHADQTNKAELTTTRGTVMTDSSNMHWVGTWTTTPDPMEGMALAGQTVRMITRISIGGARLRAHLQRLRRA